MDYRRGDEIMNIKKMEGKNTGKIIKNRSKSLFLFNVTLSEIFLIILGTFAFAFLLGQTVNVNAYVPKEEDIGKFGVDLLGNPVQIMQSDVGWDMTYLGSTLFKT